MTPERRQLTVMMCDMVGSAALALRLDPETLVDVIQAYRHRCADVIARHGGMVAQYVGDGIMAYFGYPLAHEDDAERAIRAALSIAATEGPATETNGVHIGIATGVVVVGDIGANDPSPAGAEVSAVGIAPNLAARLQALAGPGVVIVSEETRRLSRGIFEYSDLGPHDLKGFEQPVHAWQVVGEREVRSRFRALRPPELTPLVGRQSELQQLQQLWSSVQSGRGRAVLLSGEPGVGKSRLAEVIARRVVSRRCLRLWYYCSPNLQSSPLAPLARQVTQVAGLAVRDDVDAKLAKLARLVPKELSDAGETVPLLASLLSIPYESRYPPLNMSPQREKQRLFQVLMRFLEGLASRGPMLLVVEDLHWIDPSSEELLALLMDRLPGLPMLAVLTTRLAFQSSWSEVVPLSLSPLERNDSITMIESLCGNKNLPPQTISQIADKTDGLPLFIEDVTKDILEIADVPTALTQSRFTIPATLTDSLMSRLDRLGSAKTVAQVGAVIGRDFSHALLAKVADLPEEQLQDELQRLVESGLLISGRATYAFKHALVRDVAYSSLLKKGRMALHARIAQSLMGDFPETGASQPEVLAYHFEAAEDVDNAVDYLVKGAKLSARHSGFVEAISQLQRALSLLGAQPTSRERTRRELRVYLALGGVNAEYRGFSSSECGAAYARALDLCRALGDAPEIFAVLSGVGSFEITRASFAKCRVLAEECLERAAQQQAKPPFVMGHLLFGGTQFLTGEFTSARQHLERALSFYEQDQVTERGKQVLQVQDQKSTGLCYLALTLTMTGSLDSGLRAGEGGLAHSQSRGGLHTINFSLCYLAAVHYIARDPRGALRRATQSLESAREQGFATWIGISQAIRGASLVSNGEFETGLEEIASGLRAHTAMDAVAYQPFALALYAEGLLAAGRLDEALAALDQALAISERTGERFYAAELRRLKGEVLTRKGNSSEAESWLREAIEISKAQRAKLFELRSAVSLCRAVDESRRETLLRNILAPIYHRFEEGADAPDVRDARALLAVLVEASHNG